MLKRRTALALAGWLMAQPLAAWAQLPPSEPCSNASAISGHFNECSSLSDVVHPLPCGITMQGLCGVFGDEEGCNFSIGAENTGAYILVEWESKPPDANGNKATPTEANCGQAANMIHECDPKPEDMECPDEEISGVCVFNCEPSEPFAPVDDEVAELWGEECRAYALMPQGWEVDPWLPAEGFFTVGRAKSHVWRDIARPPYRQMVSHGSEGGALELLLAGRLSEAMLSPVTHTPLWGAEKDGAISNPWRAMKRAGICSNPNALFGSPYWTVGDGTQRRHALVRCEGTAAARDVFLELYEARYPNRAAWLASGAMASEVLPLLETVASMTNSELVCITPELAEQRRQDRKK